MCHVINREIEKKTEIREHESRIRFVYSHKEHLAREESVKYFLDYVGIGW